MALYTVGSVDEGREIIRAKGCTVLEAATWSRDGRTYMFSVESYGPATFGHPRVEVIVKALTT